MSDFQISREIAGVWKFDCNFEKSIDSIQKTVWAFTRKLCNCRWIKIRRELRKLEEKHLYYAATKKHWEYVMIIRDAMHYINIISLLTYKIGVASRHSIHSQSQEPRFFCHIYLLLIVGCDSLLSFTGYSFWDWLHYFLHKFT